MRIEPKVRAFMVTLIEALRDDGGLVPDDPEKIVSAGIERWQSSAERGAAKDNIMDRHLDLAAGLAIRFEPYPTLISRQQARDYLRMAERIAAMLETESGTDRDPMRSSPLAGP
jgi:hypothetical protein